MGGLVEHKQSRFLSTNLECPISDQQAGNFALENCHIGNFTLKEKQLEIIKAIVQQNRHVLAVLPTGYDKSLTLQLLPSTVQRAAWRC